MTVEEEVRAFTDKYIPNGRYYLANVPVPAFGPGGHTWEQVFAGEVYASEKTQRAVLKRLHDLFGNREH
jgi:hypothetical protein